MPVWKRKQKGLRVSSITFVLVIFKWHHGSEGVKDKSADLRYRRHSLRTSALTSGVWGIWGSRAGRSWGPRARRRFAVVWQSGCWAACLQGRTSPQTSSPPSCWGWTASAQTHTQLPWPAGTTAGLRQTPMRLAVTDHHETFPPITCNPRSPEKTTTASTGRTGLTN